MEYQNRQKRAEEMRANLKVRLNEMKLRLKRRRERFHLECSSFIDEELNLKRQFNDSGCLIDDDFTKQKVESLRNIKQLQEKFDEQLKKQNKERSKKLKRKETNLLDETLLSIVDVSTFKRVISKDNYASVPSRTSTPIFNEKNLRSFICKQHKKCNPIRKVSSKKMKLASQSKPIETKYFNINDNNYYNYSINLNNFDQKTSQYSSLMSTQLTNMPLEFQDFGEFKVWYV